MLHSENFDEYLQAVKDNSEDIYSKRKQWLFMIFAALLNKKMAGVGRKAGSVISLEFVGVSIKDVKEW